MTDKTWTRSRRSSLYELTVDDGAGRTRTVQLVDHGLWYKAAVGDTITATLWRGDIVLLTGRGASSRTFDNPEIRSGRALEIAVVLAVCIVPFLIGLRSRRAAR